MIKPKILLATSNQGKVLEIKKILGEQSFDLISLQQFPPYVKPVENGVSFYENALLKAKYYAEKTKLPALGDDSGLCVDALGGYPGLQSARIVAEEASDQEKYQKLLSLLEGIPFAKRQATFFCEAVLYFPTGEIIAAQGTLKGYIALKPQGEQGFGYDPVFYLRDFKQTLAQLGALKNEISHRAKAFSKLKSQLNLRSW